MEHEAVMLRGAELSKMIRGRGNRFAAELRQRVIVYGRRRRADGASWTRIGIELGMKWETVRRWCIEKRPAQLRRLEIVAEANEATKGISGTIRWLWRRRRNRRHEAVRGLLFIVRCMQQ
jgi:hypothetical protein